MVPFSFGDRALLALPQGALFWPDRRALLVADLHFEKASWFAKRGQMLPPYDSIATLADLTALVAATGAMEIWCLGDSFHDSDGCERLPLRAQDMLRSLTSGTRWTWITGNHDPAILDRCGGDVVNEAVVDGLVLRHQADPAERRPELSGHFHPKLRIRVRGKLVSRRCFVATSAQDDPSRIRRADRGARRGSPRDRARDRPRRRSAGAGRSAVAAFSDRCLNGRNRRVGVIRTKSSGRRRETPRPWACPSARYRGAMGSGRRSPGGTLRPDRICPSPAS